MGKIKIGAIKMKKIWLLTFVLFSNLCHSQHNQIKSSMEKFNIKEFEIKNVGGVYERTLDDKTVITQFDHINGYVEKKVPIKGWYYSYKEFNIDGDLIKKGGLFKKGDFPSGIWMEFDSTAKKFSEINYDKPYKLNVDAILLIVKKNHIHFSLNEKFSLIKRGLHDSAYIWIVEWKAQQGRVETLTVDDKTGKVIEKNHYLLEEQH